MQQRIVGLIDCLWVRGSTFGGEDERGVISGFRVSLNIERFRVWLLLV